jgi:chaperone modulatory protein CbpM
MSNATGPTTGAITRTTRLDPPRLDLESFSRATNLHPDLVRRFVALGLLDATKDGADELWFRPPQLAAAARLQRLRAGFALNYAALGLVADLLDRVAALETALRERPRRPRQQEPGG